MGKTFSQTLAESGRQSTIDSLRRSGQFNAAESEFNAGRGPYVGSSSSGGGGSSYEDSVRRALEMQREAAKPQIASLREGIPEIQQQFETGRQQLKTQQGGLEERYQSLLEDLGRQRGVQETSQTRTTSRELGRRGIVGSSGVADTALTQALDPIRERFASLTKDVGLSREQDIEGIRNAIAQLVGQETSQVRGVKNAIAQLLSGDFGTASTLALNRVQQEEQSRQFDINNQLAKQLAEQTQQERTLAEKIFQQISLPNSQSEIAKRSADVTSSAGSGTMSLQDFISSLGTGTATGSITNAASRYSTFTPN